MSADRCVPNVEKINSCNQFSKTVLKKAIFEDSTLPEKDIPTRFVKDEKQALVFINSYDPTKLSFSERNCNSRNYQLDCAKKDIKEPLDCEFSFPVLNYFRGLIKGMKINGWSSKTITFAEDVIKKHVSYVFSSEPQLIDMLITFEIIRDAESAGFLKNTFKDANNLSNEAEKLNEDIHNLSKNWQRPLSCENRNKIHQKVEQAETNLMKKFLMSNINLKK